MRRCSKCLMPDTKPGLILNREGICQACVHYEMRKNIDWEKRFRELQKLSGKHKRNDGYYDSIIAVSGGKDSYFQVYVFKELLGMNPLLIAVSDPFTKTKAGLHNLKNIGESFNCDLISLQLSPDLVRRMCKITFEEFGRATWPIDQAIYAYPLKMAIRLNIPLVVYGENISWEYGGVLSEETYSAKDQINNTVAKKIDWHLWFERGVKKEEINMLISLSQEEIENAKLEPIYLSYFIPWDGYKNYMIAKKYGFKDLNHEWIREGYIDSYDQIDSVGYLMNSWLKYPKFGFQRTTDLVGYWIRSGRINKEEGIKFIKENDHKLDQKILEDFMKFIGYTCKEFWDIVDKFYNKDIFEKVDGQWRLKDTI